MWLIVSDTSYLIDLQKASLLEALTHLSYEIGIPDVLLEELVRFELAAIDLIDTQFKKLSLPGEGVFQVQTIAQV